MIVNEIFYSLQGEGFLAGVPSVFIRLSGCPVRCHWCDTKYAHDYQCGRQMSVDEIVTEACKYKCSHIVATGGEPLADANMAERPELRHLLGEFKRLDRHITVETSAVLYVPSLACDLMSISPKLLGTQHEPNIKAINKMISEYEYQLKFVVGSVDELEGIRELLSDLKDIDRSKVMLMPRCSSRDEYLQAAPWVADMCKKNGFAFSPRLHLMLWDSQKRR